MSERSKTAFLSPITWPFLAVYFIFKAVFWGKKTYKNTQLAKEAAQPTFTCGTCQHEHNSSGAWQCPKCGAKHMGWVWDACPICNTVAAYIDCEKCGMAIGNPMNRAT